MMRILKEGHLYHLAHLDGNDNELLQFVNRGHGCDQAGTTNQELLRVLIDRVEFLDNELQWHGNDIIINHLRKALVLHEARHVERLIDKEGLKVETISTGIDGHFILSLQPL